MFVLKAFATNSTFTNNIPGKNSTIGEISTQSLTYSQNKGYYKSTLSANIDLFTFTSAIDNTPYQLTQDLVDQTITIIAFIYNASTASGAQIYADVLLNSLFTTFATTANNFACGEIVSNGKYTIPEWVSWTSLDIANIGTGNEIKIWFNDPSFQAQYDDYQLVVVPPITPIDGFFTSPTNIKSLLAANTPPIVTNLIQNAKNGFPESILTTNEYNFVDPTNPTNLIPTAWNLLIYGAAGNNVDVIQNTLIQYILANTTKTQAQWTAIFPDIFKVTEFIIMPNWDKYSIPNMTLQSGIYSPSIVMSNALALLTSKVTNYPSAHINANADIFSQPYKSLTLMSIGSPDNNNGIFNISTMFPDFIDVSSTSSDFSRMSQSTQDWANLLDRAIISAETLTAYSNVPVGMSKVTRNNILYLVFKFNNIDYLVSAKSSF